MGRFLRRVRVCSFYNKAIRKLGCRHTRGNPALEEGVWREVLSPFWEANKERVTELCSLFCNFCSVLQRLCCHREPGDCGRVFLSFEIGPSASVTFCQSTEVLMQEGEFNPHLSDLGLEGSTKGSVTDHHPQGPQPCGW